MIAQVLAVIIFLAMFVLIITEIWERHYVTLGCALLTLFLVFGVGMHSMSAVWETLNLYSFLHPSSGIVLENPPVYLQVSIGKPLSS